MKSYLHMMGKSDTPGCPTCDHHTEDGDHTVFHCPSLKEQRDTLLRGRASWKELDEKVSLQQEGEEDPIETTEEFFHHVFLQLTPPDRGGHTA